MKSFLLPIGHYAGASLPTVLSALSCGASVPVSGLDILHITETDADPVVPLLVRDLNRSHTLLEDPENGSLFPSSFVFESWRPALPSHRTLSGHTASSALLAALRGKGVPLSYKTDRDAVEWAFSLLLSAPGPGETAPFIRWLDRIRDCADGGEPFRVGILCDLSDPFSAGTAFAVLRYLNRSAGIAPASLALFGISVNTGSDQEMKKNTFFGAVKALSEQNLIGRPDKPGLACADAMWLLGLPSALCESPESLRLLYLALAVQLGRFFSVKKAAAPGLHTVELPGILTLQSLGSQAVPFASFMHTAVWMLSDLIPALGTYCERSTPLRTLTPNTRNGLFRRLFRGEAASAEQKEDLQVLKRSFVAVLSEVLALIRFLPDSLRLAEVSDPLWKQVEDACGRTVTVASEYAVSLEEAEEGGILGVKPVHRVSMADTVEEMAERRVSDLAEQLKNEDEIRARLFKSSGSCWTATALRNCRERCVAALSKTKDQLAGQAAETEADHYAIASLTRRIRLLEAAVARCDKDLADPDLQSAEPGKFVSSEKLTPYAGQILAAEAAEKLSALVSAAGTPDESVRKEVLAGLPGLFYGFTLADSKSLFKQLLAACSPERKPHPLACLFLSALDVSRGQIQPLRLMSAGKMPSIPLLPDLNPAAPLITVSALLPLLPDSREQAADSVAEKRGLLAMLLLRQYRRRTSEEAGLALQSFVPSDSPVLQAWLASRCADKVWILSLEQEEACLPFALVLPGQDLLPARISASHTSLIPAFAFPWFDADSLSFRDPCTLMSEGDRRILLSLLPGVSEALAENKNSTSLRSFLKAFEEDLRKAQEAPALPERLSLRLKASFGLRLLPAFKDSLVRRTCCYERTLPSDEIAARLTGQTVFPAFRDALPDDIVFYYRDVPFARENSRTLLDAVPLPAEKWTLDQLERECGILAHASDDYHDFLLKELNALLERYPDALPDARHAAEYLRELAAKPVTETSTDLVWPWDPKSPSVLTILSESLGAALSAAALQPFSDRLALFPARSREVIGDSLMSSMCILPPATPTPSSSDNPEEEPAEAPVLTPDAVLPPLSEGFCAALCMLPEGKTLIRPGLLDFERRDDGAVRTTLTLEGSFTVRLIRDFPEEEIVRLYSHDIPTLAVWPDLPFAPEDWHAYYLYAGLPQTLQVTARCADGTSVSSVPEETRAVCCSASFPLSFTIRQGESVIGSLPNLLPSPEIQRAEPYTACVDFGSTGTSVVFSVGHRRIPLQGSTLVRTLLNNPSVSPDLLRREFLPAVPVSALLPTASRIFRNRVGEAPRPFEDGIVLMSADLRDTLSIPSGALYTCLKWEEEKGRSVELCIHQIMLMAALQARCDGAASLAWRFAVPDEMARAGRERLTALFTALAEQVNQESGFGLPEKQPPVTFAAESSALGAYFRFCASEDTRGGFMVLDIGACTADISLFLRGREQAIRTCQIPLGVHYMLLPALLRDPDMLHRDLAFVQDPGFQQDLALLEKIIKNAKADPSALRHSRLALDSFLADRYTFLVPGLLQNPATGMPTRFGSILLLHLSFLMMLSGLILLQIAADPGKNDFLPEQMSLCLSGRGAILPEYLPDQYKTALWHFLTMFRNRRVASLSMLFSSEKKLEIPVGLTFLQSVSTDLPPASTVPAAISVRPEELLPEFILRFAREFPASAEMLFHGFFTSDFYHPFSAYGESLVTAAIAQSFTEQTAHKPYDALSAWIGSLLELIDSHIQ